MSQFLLVLVSTNNDGGAKFSYPTFTFLSFFKFQTTTSKIECIFPSSAAYSDLEEGWNIRETFGCQCCESSVVQPMLLLLTKDQVLKTITVHLLLQKKRRLCFDQQRSWTLLSTCCTVFSSIDHLGFCTQRQQTCGSRGQQGFAAACVFVALLLPVDLCSGTKWNSFCSLLVTHQEQQSINKSNMFALTEFIILCYIPPSCCVSKNIGPLLQEWTLHLESLF